MSIDWDGKNFRAIDDAGVGDGTGGNTMFLDAGLEHGVRNNEMFIRKYDPGVSYSPTPAKVASVDWSVFWGGWVPIDVDVDTVRVKLITEVGTDDSNSTNPDSEYATSSRLRLGRDPDLESVVETSLTGGSDTTVTHEVDLTQQNLNRWARLNLAVKSGIGSTAIDNEDLLKITGNGTWTVNTGTSGFDNHGTVFAYSYDAQDVKFEEVRNRNDFDMTMMTPAYQSAGEFSQDTFFASSFWMGWLRPKAVILEFDRDKTSVNLDQRQITHRQAYEAQWSSYKHARATRENYTRPRAVSLGDKAVNTWDDVHWNTGTTEVFSDSAKLDGQSDSSEDGTLEIQYSYVGLHAVAGYTPVIRNDNVEDAINEILNERNATADLTTTLHIQQLEAGDTWNDPTVDESASDTIKEVKLFPTDETGAIPVLQQIRHMRLNDAGDTVEDETVNHEGQLFWKRDRAVVRRGQMTLQPNEANITFGRSVRVLLEVSLANTSFSLNFDSAERSDDRAGVLLTDLTAWWHPA